MENFENLMSAVGFLQHGLQVPYSLLCKHHVFLNAVRVSCFIFKGSTLKGVCWEGKSLLLHLKPF